MKVLDVNVLLAAFREDHPHWPIARPWLDRAVESEPVAVPHRSAVGFGRLATNARVFSRQPPSRRR